MAETCSIKFYSRVIEKMMAIIMAITACSSSTDLVPEVKLQAGFDFSPKSILVGEQVSFSNTSKVGLATVSYAWDYGDGNQSAEKDPVHTYQQLGVYAVTLQVSDLQNNTDQHTEEVDVAISNQIEVRAGLVDQLKNQGNQIMVCAHRAFHKNFPENSIGAIQDAINEEVGMVEIDIRSTKDGELVLMHDKTIDRTTNGSGNVAGFTRQELREFYLLKSGQSTTQTIPTLEEVLIMARGKIYIDLDVKIENYTKVYQLVNRYGMLGQVMFSLDELQVAKNLHGANKNVVLFPTVRSQADFDQYKNAQLNISIMQINSTSLNNTVVQQAKVEGIMIFRNVYVNSNETPASDKNGKIDDFIKLEGSIIQTDHPQDVKKYLKSKKLN